MKMRQLQRELQDVLGLPHKKSVGPSAKITQTIFSMMVQALRRGEKVHIAGFGILKTHTRKAGKQPRTFFYNHVPTYLIVDEPAKTYVKFIPAASILRTLNHGH